MKTTQTSGNARHAQYFTKFSSFETSKQSLWTIKARASLNMEELNSSLIIFELMGLQYFSLKLLTLKNASERPSITRTVYMLVVLVVMTAIAFWFVTTEAVLKNEAENLTAKNILTFAIQHSLNFGFTLVIVSSVVQSFVTNSKVKKIYLNIREVADIAQESFNVKVNFTAIKRTLSRKLKILVVSFLSLQLTIFFIKSEPRPDVVAMLVGIIPMMYLLMVAYKFVIYVSMVNSQMKFVLKLIEEVFKEPPIPIKTVDAININFMHAKRINKNEYPMRKLLAVRRIFNLIYDNGKLINESNGFTILIVLIDLVIAITASGYKVFVIILGGMPMADIPGKI